MKKYTQYIIVGALLLSCSLGYGQVKKADKKFNDFEYVDARDIYKRIAEKGNNSPDILQKLGDAYYYTSDYREASLWYGKLISAGGDVPSEYYFRNAQALKSIGRYAEADKMMDSFEKSSSGDSRGDMFVKERNYLKEIEKQSGRFTIETLDINTELQDFSPSFYGDKVIFSSNRQGGIGKLIHSWNEQPFLDLYIIDDPKSGGKKAELLEGPINTKYHESSTVFSQDGQVMYFTRNNLKKRKLRRDNQGTTKLKLYRSLKEGNNWGKPEELPFNSDEYSVAHPALSSDGGTLYFASDMPGTKGMSDLWKATINADGTFGEPENLGPTINTEARETFPFISAKNKLFFASDGHVGLGGLDVFVTELDENGMPGDAYNAGRPVNSAADDFGLILNETNGQGYFSSNRGTGEGNDDIYAILRKTELLTACAQNISGVTRDLKTDEILPLANVQLRDKQNNVIAQTKSDVAGNFTFEDVDCSATYAIRAEKEEFEPAEAIVITDSEVGRDVKRSLYLKPLLKVAIGDDLAKTLDLNPIYFDLDKSFIRPDAGLELEKVIAVLKEVPTMKIDVRSHTDSRSSDVYNLKLSQRRNVETIRYIVEKGGISATRITGNGYGETRLLNACGNGIDCNEAEHQINRRSEFIIVEK